MSRSISELDMAHIYEECVFVQSFPHLLQEKSVFAPFFKPVNAKDPNSALRIIHQKLGILGKTAVNPETGKEEQLTNIELLPISNRYKDLRSAIDEQNNVLFIARDDGKRYFVRKEPEGGRHAQYEVFEFDREHFIGKNIQPWFRVNKETGHDINLVRDLVPAYTKTQVYVIKPAAIEGTKVLQHARKGRMTGLDMQQKVINYIQKYYRRTFEQIVERGIQQTLEYIVNMLKNRDKLITLGSEKISDFILAYEELIRLLRSPDDLKRILTREAEKFFNETNLATYGIEETKESKHLKYHDWSTFETKKVDWDRLTKDFIQYLVKGYLSKYKIQTDILDMIANRFGGEE